MATNIDIQRRTLSSLEIGIQDARRIMENGGAAFKVKQAARRLVRLEAEADARRVIIADMEKEAAAKMEAAEARRRELEAARNVKGKKPFLYPRGYLDIFKTSGFNEWEYLANNIKW